MGNLYWQRRDQGRNPNGEYVNLRGGIFLRIFLPIPSDTIYDAITVVTTREAWRDRGEKGDTQSKTTQITLPDTLWNDLRSLQSSWCAQVPSTKHPTPGQAVYRIELACPPIHNPVLFEGRDKA